FPILPCAVSACLRFPQEVLLPPYRFLSACRRRAAFSTSTNQRFIFPLFSVSMIQISGINLLLLWLKLGGIPVRHDHITGLRKFIKAPDHSGTEKSLILKRGLVEYDLGSLSLQPLHYTLDGALTEIVGIGFHRKTVNADRNRSAALSASVK